MLPKWWCDTVTVFRKSQNEYDETEWTKFEFKNCFWSKESGERIISGTLFKDVETIIRIPVDNNKKILNTMKIVKEDDIVLKGKTTVDIDEYKGPTSNDFVEANKDIGCIRVKSFFENNGAFRPLQHIAIKGK